MGAQLRRTTATGDAGSAGEAVPQIGLEAAEASRPNLGEATVTDTTARKVEQVRFEAGEAAIADLRIATVAHRAATAGQEVRLATREAARSNLGIAALAHAAAREIEKMSFVASDALSPNFRESAVAHATPAVEGVHEAGKTSRPKLLDALAADSTARWRSHIIEHSSTEARKA